MNYLADHAQTQIAEVRQIPGKDGTITLPAMSYTTFNKKWSDSLKEQKAEAERKAAKEKQPKKDAEQITEGTKSKENASQATTATQKQKKK